MSVMQNTLILRLAQWTSPTFALACLFAATPAAAAPNCPDPDLLYIADVGDNTVAKFDALTGDYLGDLVFPPDNGGLNGPMGLIFAKRGGANSDLFLVNQNFGVPNTCIGDLSRVLTFDRDDGTFLGQLVPSSMSPAPFAARGMVLGKHHTLYLADAGCSFDLVTFPGRLTTWNSKTGAFLGDLDATDFTNGPFRPRGVVFGPDGDLYVSVSYILGPPAGPGGAVVKFDPQTGLFLDVIYDCPSDNSDPTCDLHRPEGLVFGPDGLLYVTSFRKDSADIDRILIFDVESSNAPPLAEIALYQPGEDRAFAQALLFGPGDKLYVPISGGSAPNTGSVRKYDVSTENFDFDVIVPPFASVPPGPLQAPFYLTFGQTDPATLEYEGHPDCP